MNKEELNKYVQKGIENCFKELANNPEEFFDNYKLQEKYNKILKENINLKQALKEIREILEKYKDLGVAGELDYYIIRQDILQIIDKVLRDDEK